MKLVIKKTFVPVKPMDGALWPSVEAGWKHVSPSPFLTIDPGLQGTGWALWSRREFKNLVAPLASGVLVPTWTNPEGDELPWQYVVSRFATEIVFGLHNRFRRSEPSVWYVEEPAFMEGGKGMVTARSGSLLKLMSLYGAILGASAGPSMFSIVPVPVAVWKGQTPKEIIARRVMKRLPNWTPTTKATHEIDAVGIGLFLKGHL